MGEWYNEMWRRGVRFHYVSNGPFELISVINEFFEASRLPPGSVRLKSYAGRSLFNGLLSAPATRKRSGILDILDNFLDSRFILIGDSGEQDLELYAAMAKERPQQILAVFIRDVGAFEDASRELEDLTGLGAVYRLAAASKDKDYHKNATVGRKTSVKRGSEPNPAEVPFTPKPLKRSMSEMAFPIRVKPTLSKLNLSAGNVNNGSGGSNFLASSAGSDSNSPMPWTPSRSRQLYNDPDRSNSPSAPGAFYSEYPANMSEQDKKRTELQMRVYKARAQMPSHVFLRVFRKAEECVEVSEILDRLHVGHV